MTGFNPVRIIEVLARHGVDFVVIGGFAAELYRVPVPPTQDIDVTPRMAVPNLARLSAALYELGARIRTAEVPEGLPFSHDASSLARARMWNLTTTAGNFDVSFFPTGTEGYEDLVVNAVVVDVDAHQVAVASLADVVRSKEAAGRPKDLAVLAILRRRLQTLTGVDLDELRPAVLQALRRRQDGGTG